MLLVPHERGIHVVSPERNGSAIPVKFARSSVETAWSQGDGTLLELAEKAGLAPAFGCRSGICGTCKVRIISGHVDYLEEPLAEHGEGEILLCCSVPGNGQPQNGERSALVLDV